MVLSLFHSLAREPLLAGLRAALVNALCCSKKLREASEDSIGEALMGTSACLSSP